MTMEIESHGTEMKIPVSTPENRALVVSTEPTTHEDEPQRHPDRAGGLLDRRGVAQAVRVWRGPQDGGLRRRSTRSQGVGLVTPRRR